MKKLKLLLIPLLVLAFFNLKATPTHAGIFDLWGSISCAADIDCTIRAASTAAGNYVVYSMIGKDFEEISATDVDRMARGDWDEGFLAAAGKFGSLAYSMPPTQFKRFVQTGLSDNILSSPAQAQTLGQGVLEPVQDVWSGMRNVAYGLFVIVVVAIGFMIILRREVSPRVVVTFTSALPKILMGLVLITFSYPLIALIVDIGGIFASNLVFSAVSDAFGPITADIAGGGLASTFSDIPAVAIGQLLKVLVGIQIGVLPTLIFLVLFSLAAVVLLGLTFIRVFVAWGFILIYTVFSPILLLFGTLPGQEGAITNFFKNVLAKTLVFPVVFFFSYLGLGFAATSYLGTTENLISGTFGDLVGGVLTAQGTVGAILALVMLAAAFKAPAMVEDALDIEGMFGKK